ncbi:FAD-binding protein [Sphingobium sp. YR768]|uniref:FAD-binding protein n=1 Tax=Sphingobium sp. YR768 TaxID=1884365 RepID=UPI0008D5BDF8|nr:FAD-binding protein [Sphingobium sp. YR768]SES15634.1 3-oxosteroid 1-dehydrogenase [Sphingobium sp. YR768]
MSKWNEVVDIVIIGSGAGSMVAALKAKRLGLSSVIIEKRFAVGGSTGFSGGVLWVPCNPLMKREGVHDDLAEARRYMDVAAPYFGPASTSERRNAYLNTGPEVIEFLLSEGLELERPAGFPDYYTTRPGASKETRSVTAKLFDINKLGEWKQRLSVYPLPAMPLRIGDMAPLLLAKRTWRGRIMALRLAARLAHQKLTGSDYRGSGAAVQGRMLKLSLDAGIDIRPETPFESFVVENDRVMGVVARRAGRELRIGAKRGVIINAGGFSHDAEMRTKYGRPISAQTSQANPGDTGEVLSAAMKLGVAVDCMDEAIWTGVSLGQDGALPPGVKRTEGGTAHFGHHWDISFPHSIVVDTLGRRFANEAGAYMEFGQRLHQRHGENGGSVPAWAIIESRHRKNYLWANHFGATPKAWIESGYMIEAGSIMELAAKTGIPGANLEETITRFNRFAETGRDEDYQRGDAAYDRFHGDPTVKPNPNLGAISKPPFFAVRMFAGDVGTVGGIVTDVDGRALREDGTVVDGLFATGNSAASPLGKSYIGAGTSVAASMIFAYRAVQAMSNMSNSSAEKTL